MQDEGYMAAQRFRKNNKSISKPNTCTWYQNDPAGINVPGPGLNLNTGPEYIH